MHPCFFICFTLVVKSIKRYITKVKVLQQQSFHLGDFYFATSAIH